MTQTNLHYSTPYNKTGRWCSRFLELASLVASWSKDPGARVGAVIVDPGNRVVSLGFNGLPRGVEDSDSRLLDREVKLGLTIHAEANAMAFANRDLTGCTLYVTHPPCSNCAAMIVQRSLGKVVYLSPSATFLSRWADSLRLSHQVLLEAGVEVQEVVGPTSA